MSLDLVAGGVTVQLVDTPETDEPRRRLVDVAVQHKTGGFSDRIVPMRLDNICGEHSIVEELYIRLGLPYFPQPKVECLPKEIVRILLERTPLLICQEQKDREACIGNVRVYRLARFALDPTEVVPTIRYAGSLTGKRRERLCEALLIETFLMPEIFGRRPAELKALSTAWERATTLGLLEFWKGSGFAELYRSDPQPLMRKRAQDRR
jgi:hypothetical protein